ncbi:MAG TPA: hypothetical protein VK724_26295 [Bryobacteraceae bacterium]|jgi:hypothetical protein|nr:hypothetical protein [Bryobacteraceae bacterium]
MQKLAALAVAAACCSFLFGQEPAPVRPKAGKVQIFKEADLKPGMKGYAWTVLKGSEPEPLPVEILGIYKNQWGPKQDVILAKLGGKGQRTNVAAGMSGSPVYIDGKLVGAIALRFSTFSPDALCGITPIELMLEVNEFDDSLPSNARTPGKSAAHNAASADNSTPGGPSLAFAPLSGMVPIETPLNFAGFNENVVPEFAPEFQSMGMTVAGGGAASTMISSKPVKGWEQSLQPGDAVSGVLVTGDMSISAMCTVTYNDGKHVLFCGHSFFNLGPVDMPMAKADVITTLASQYQPTKFGNATEIVGALKQDRHSGVLGDLGDTADMVPVTLKVRSFGDNNTIRKERDLHFSVFVQQKWTPYLMMMTLFNSISSLNEFAEETTYRLSGKVALDGQPGVSLSTMLAANEGPAPVPNQLAGWWGDKFNRLFLNPVQIPKLKSVDAVVDILPDRRIAMIENAWVPASEVEAGTEVPVKVFVRPYRGERIERDFTLKIPAGLPKGEHRVLFSDADTLNRLQSAAAASEPFIDIKQTVSLMNQERSNNKLYVSLVEPRPTVFYEDKTLPSLPASIMNVMQTDRTASRRLQSSAESAMEQGSIPFDMLIEGSFSLRISVK